MRGDSGWPGPGAHAPPGLRSDGYMKVIACKHATQLPVPPPTTHGPAHRPRRSVTPERGGCNAAGTRVSGVSQMLGSLLKRGSYSKRGDSG